MGNTVACAEGGRLIYIASDIEDLIGLKPDEVMALPSLDPVAPNLGTAQNKFKEELAKPRGRFHSYAYQSELRHKDGTMVAIEHIVLIVDPGLNNNVFTVSVIHPVCHCSLLRKVVELWPRLSEASARLVCGIVESLAHFAV